MISFLLVDHLTEDPKHVSYLHTILFYSQVLRAMIFFSLAHDSNSLLFIKHVKDLQQFSSSLNPAFVSQDNYT